MSKTLLNSLFVKEQNVTILKIANVASFMRLNWSPFLPHDDSSSQSVVVVVWTIHRTTTRAKYFYMDMDTKYFLGVCVRGLWGRVTHGVCHDDPAAERSYSAGGSSSRPYVVTRPLAPARTALPGEDSGHCSRHGRSAS